MRPPGGLVAARFRNYEARSGMPLLQDRLLLLSVKGQRLDGTWGSIHITAPHESFVAASALLEEELARGPAAHGWPDQRWTLARIKTLIGRRFHTSMTLSGVSRMLRCRGWSHEVPALRAVERRGSRRRLGEGGVATPGTAAAALGAWIVFEDEAGFSMTPPTPHGGQRWIHPGRPCPGPFPASLLRSRPCAATGLAKAPA
ncbi:helix-turn-helix domain-containing protein [[Kitasatospora] papulosa]